MMKCMPFWKGCNRNVDYIDQSHRCLTVVPDEVLRYARTLEELLLDSNQIRDLPQSFFSLIQLRKLSLNDNQIARLTNDIGNLTNLQELDVSHNELMHIPENIKQCKSLQVADFSSNPLKELPEGLTQLKNLTHLILNDVAIRRLPEEIGSLINLESLELRDNLLSQFPSSLSQLVNLQFLDAGSNMIEEVPDFIGSLCKLEELRLDCNEILELPAELGGLKKLTQLDMSENKLERLPQEIGDLTNMTDLHLSQNQLEYLPDGIGSLQKLCTLKIDQNHLVQLTPAVGNCSALQELILTENILTELPGTIGKLKSLTILNVDRNRLTNIPAKIGGCAKLGVLSLRENVLWRLPPELGFLKELHVLDVSGNRLQHLPLSLGTCNLKALWLSENQAQPLLKFQQDVDEETGEKVLTCFLLPQQAFTDSMENLLKDSFAVMSDRDSRFSWLDHTRGSSVKFAEDEHEPDSEDDEMHKAPVSLSDDENRFVRHNTPHPKDLRVRHNKLFIRDVDGHMIPHKQKREPDSGFIPSHDHDSSAIVQSESVANDFDIDEQVTAYDDTATEKTNYDTAEDEPSQDNTLTETRPGEDDEVDAARTEGVLQKDLSSPKELNKVDDMDGILPKSKQMAVHIVRSAGIGLGISIAGGLGSCPFVDDDEGIFISKVNSNGIAEREGLLVGDKVISVNGNSLENVEHSRAVSVLRNAGYDITLVIVRTSATSSQEAANGTKGTTQDTKLDTPGLVSMSPPVLKAASRSLEVVESSDPHVSSGATAEKEDERRKQRHSPRLPAAIHKEPEADKFLTPIGNSALPSTFNVQGLVEKTTEPLNRDSLHRNSSPDANRAPYKESNSPGRTVVMQYQADRSPHHVQQSSSALTPVNRSPRVQSASPQSRAKDKLGLTLKTSLALEDSSTSVMMDSASVKKTSHISPSPSTSLLASSGASSDVYPKEKVVIVKAGGPLGLSIVGGRGHTSHPFGIDEPGIFISKIQSHGTAAKTSKLRIGDRILAVNGESMENASHQEAVMALIAPTNETVLDVRHDPQPPGLKEVVIHKPLGERLGLSITGGAGTPCGNVTDVTDEGIFISRIIAGTVVARDGRLSVGMRILEVNGQSLLGTTQQEAAQMLQSAGNSLSLLLCHGFDIMQPKHDLSTSPRVLSKESEILTPCLNKPPVSSNCLPPPPGSSAKAVLDKSLTYKTVEADHELTSNAIAAEINRNEAVDSGKLNGSSTAGSNSSQTRPIGDAKSILNDISDPILAVKPVVTSKKGLSAEEERRTRAEQRKITRLKFLQEAASKTQETSKVLKDFPHNNLIH